MDTSEIARGFCSLAVLCDDNVLSGDSMLGGNWAQSSYGSCSQQGSGRTQHKEKSGGLPFLDCSGQSGEVLESATKWISGIDFLDEDLLQQSKLFRVKSKAVSCDCVLNREIVQCVRRCHGADCSNFYGCQVPARSRFRGACLTRGHIERVNEVGFQLVAVPTAALSSYWQSEFKALYINSREGYLPLRAPHQHMLLGC